MKTLSCWGLKMPEDEIYQELLKRFILLNPQPTTTMKLIRVMANSAVVKADSIRSKRGLGYDEGWTGEDERNYEAGEILQGVEGFLRIAEERNGEELRSDMF